MLVTYCSLHFYVFPLKIIDNFLLTSAETLKLWRKFRENFCLLILLPYKICSVDTYSIKLGDLIYILVIPVVFKFFVKSIRGLGHYSKPPKTETYVKLFSIISKLRQVVNGNDS